MRSHVEENPRIVCGIGQHVASRTSQDECRPGTLWFWCEECSFFIPSHIFSARMNVHRSSSALWRAVSLFLRATSV